MSTQTEFDKELTRIIVDVYNMGWNDRYNKKILTSIGSIAQAIDESKQAVDKYVIGKDEMFIDIPIMNNIGEVERVITGELFTPYMVMRNTVRKDQRLALWEKQK